MSWPVEASHLPTKQTLRMLGIPSSTYYDWYARWVAGGVDALADRSPRPRSVWNRIPDEIRKDVVEFGCNNATVIQKPRLLSDNGSSYVASDLAAYLEDKGVDHVRGAPHHPQTQGKIERWHQTMKNRVLLENYFLPSDLERQIGAFVDHYNNHRYHQSLDNLTPANVYHGCGAKILKMPVPTSLLQKYLNKNEDFALYDFKENQHFPSSCLI